MLTRATLRCMPWGQMFAGGALGLVLVVLSPGGGDLSMSMLVDRIRLASLLLALGVSGALDDATRPYLDGVPVPLHLRHGLRICVAGAVTAAWWVLILVTAGFRSGAEASAGDAGTALPLVAVTVVAVALVTATLAVAAAASRRRPGAGLVAGASTTLVGTTILALWAPLRAAMWPGYPLATGTADVAWVAAQQRWALVAVVAVIGLRWSIRDPWSPTALRAAWHLVSGRRARHRPPRGEPLASSAADRTTERTAT